jgi:hypothetical protein
MCRNSTAAPAAEHNDHSRASLEQVHHPTDEAAIKALYESVSEKAKLLQQHHTRLPAVEKGVSAAPNSDSLNGGPKTRVGAEADECELQKGQEGLGTCTEAERIARFKALVSARDKIMKMNDEVSWNPPSIGAP